MMYYRKLLIIFFVGSLVAIMGCRSAPDEYPKNESSLEVCTCRERSSYYDICPACISNNYNLNDPEDKQRYIKDYVKFLGLDTFGDDEFVYEFLLEAGWDGSEGWIGGIIPEVLRGMGLHDPENNNKYFRQKLFRKYSIIKLKRNDDSLFCIWSYMKARFPEEEEFRYLQKFREDDRIDLPLKLEFENGEILTYDGKILKYQDQEIDTLTERVFSVLIDDEELTRNGFIR